MNNAEKHLTRTREEQNQILSLWGRTFFGSSSCQQEPVNILRVCARMKIEFSSPKIPVESLLLCRRPVPEKHLTRMREKGKDFSSPKDFS